MELEREGQVDLAMALYEQNVAEGFAADWPYGRLGAIYERLGRPEDALRVLEPGRAAARVAGGWVPRRRAGAARARPARPAGEGGGGGVRPPGRGRRGPRPPGPRWLRPREFSTWTGKRTERR